MWPPCHSVTVRLGGSSSFCPHLRLLSLFELLSSQTPSIALSLPHHPLILDSSPLQLSYVLAFDGFPRFLDTGVVQSDRSLIAAFCGQRRDRPLTVQALSGMGTGGMGPLSGTVLCPCTLLPEVGSRPSLTVPATDLLGDAILATSGSQFLQLKIVLPGLCFWKEGPNGGHRM